MLSAVSDNSGGRAIKQEWPHCRSTEIKSQRKPQPDDNRLSESLCTREIK